LFDLAREAFPGHRVGVLDVFVEADDWEAWGFGGDGWQMPTITKGEA
jgi:hypothetical protein